MQSSGVGVLLETDRATYLFQERDHNTHKSPGQIAPFGGGLEDGESLEECAVREMQEELNLKLDVQDLQDMGAFESHNTPQKYIQIFLARNIDKSKLQLNEGKEIIELSLEDALTHPNVTDFTKKVLEVLG